MKLIACTLKNVESTIEIDQSETIETLSNMISSSMNNTTPGNKIRLIHAGKILKMEQRISDYSDIKDGDKIIVLFSKQVAKIIIQPEAVTTQVSSQNTSQNTTQNKTQNTTQASTTPANITSNPTIEDPNTLLVGDELDRAITSIVEMGFDIESVKRAMELAYNNPNRAIELLTSNEIGIVENEEEYQGNRGALDDLRQHPMFEQMRAIVRGNPQTLPQILSLIGQSDPSLLQTITENQDEFIQLLSEPLINTNDDYIDNQSITLTPEEMESITRLEGLGFSRPAAVEAFLACDKNEEMAANYLLENIADYLSDNDN